MKKKNPNSAARHSTFTPTPVSGLHTRPPAPTVVMPPPIRVVAAGFGYQICAACTGNGCHACKGMGEVPAAVESGERRVESKKSEREI